MIFVDTSAWFGCVVPSDDNYLSASRWFSENNEPLLTTDYVVDETLTLLRARGETVRAENLGEAFFSDSLCTIYFLTELDIRETWQVFQRFSDKEWSFTDCSSKVVMSKLRIDRAFAFDRHFNQFGSVAVLP
ncbi:MAG: PIN domain-containing protein [Pseudanabaena sp. CAN_BIN31]|nr:PIN domain-containing protein [Pseudanabaena sp. CAN_BIN31]